MRKPLLPFKHFQVVPQTEYDAYAVYVLDANGELWIKTVGLWHLISEDIGATL